MADLVADADILRAKRALIKHEFEQEQLKECTFAPDTSKPRLMGYYEEYKPPEGHARLSISSALKEVGII